MKRIISLVVACFVFSAAGAALAAEAGKIGYVDVQKVLNLSDAGKEAKDQLSGRVKKYQDEINVKQDELKKLKDDLEKQNVLLSETARASKEKDYQQKLKEFQRFTKDAQEELQARDEEFTKRILEQIEKVVQEYGRKSGFSIIFARNDSMIFTDENADLTDQVLKAFNANKKK